MALSDANIANNRKTLASNTKSQLGLTDLAPGDWTTDQRIAYVKSFASYVAAHPASFADIDLANARSVLQTNYGVEQDTSFDSGLFLDTAVSKAADIVDAGGSILKVSIYAGIAVAIFTYALPYIIKAFQKVPAK